MKNPQLISYIIVKDWTLSRKIRNKTIMFAFTYPDSALLLEITLKEAVR